MIAILSSYHSCFEQDSPAFGAYNCFPVGRIQRLRKHRLPELNQQSQASKPEQSSLGIGKVFKVMICEKQDLADAAADTDLFIWSGFARSCYESLGQR